MAAAAAVGEGKTPVAVPPGSSQDAFESASVGAATCVFGSVRLMIISAWEASDRNGWSSRVA